MREIRRKDRIMQNEQQLALLNRGIYGVLASSDAEGLPLATPLSYIYLDGALYFHCAMQGHKLDNIAANPAVCFCVVDGVQAVYHNNFTTSYNSVLVHGPATLVENETEKQRALMALCEKYLPQHMDKAEESIGSSFNQTAVVRIDVDCMRGKTKPMP